MLKVLKELLLKVRNFNLSKVLSSKSNTESEMLVILCGSGGSWTGCSPCYSSPRKCYTQPYC